MCLSCRIVANFDVGAYTGPICVSFLAHLHGDDVEHLEVFTRSGSTDTVVLSIKGDQSASWISRMVTIDNFSAAIQVC